MKCLGMAIDVDSAYLTFFSLSSTAGKEKNVLQIFYTRKVAGSPSEGWNKVITKSCIEYK